MKGRETDKERFFFPTHYSPDVHNSCGGTRSKAQSWLPRGAEVQELEPLPAVSQGVLKQDDEYKTEQPGPLWEDAGVPGDDVIATSRSHPGPIFQPAKPAKCRPMSHIVALVSASA